MYPVLRGFTPPHCIIRHSSRSLEALERATPRGPARDRETILLIIEIRGRRRRIGVPKDFMVDVFR
jgi:hypothetical protein